MIGSERSAGRGLSIVGTGRDGEGERGGGKRVLGVGHRKGWITYASVRDPLRMG